MKDDCTTNSHYLTYTFLFWVLRECTFWAWGVKGANCSDELSHYEASWDSLSIHKWWLSSLYHLSLAHLCPDDQVASSPSQPVVRSNRPETKPQQDTPRCVPIRLISEPGNCMNLDQTNQDRIGLTFILCEVRYSTLNINRHGMKLGDEIRPPLPFTFWSIKWSQAMKWIIMQIRREVRPPLPFTFWCIIEVRQWSG